jgi:hypothetical protein
MKDQVSSMGRFLAGAIFGGVLVFAASQGNTVGAQAGGSNLPPIFKSGALVYDNKDQAFDVREVQGDWFSYRANDDKRVFWLNPASRDKWTGERK